MERARRWFLTTIASLLTAATVPPRKQIKCSISASVTDATVSLTASAQPSWRQKFDHYLLEWGDGTVVALQGAPPSIAKHTYQTGGTFTVRLTIWDSSGQSAWDAANVGIIVYTQPATGGSGAALQVSNITHLGAFGLPADGDGSYTFGSGLTLRYRSGTPRLLIATYGNPGSGGTPGRIREISIPSDGSLATGTNPASYTNATLTRDWGDCVQNKIYDNENSLQGLDNVGSGSNNYCPIQGLYWDPVDSVLYQFLQNFYENAGTSNNCIIASTLDDGAGTGTGIGTWQLSAKGGSTPPFSTFGNRWALGATRIPDSFANTYTGGRKLGVGFGHNAASIAANGPICFGPALVAINPPSLAFDTDRSEITRGIVPVVLHPYHADAISAPYRATRPSTNSINALGALHTGDAWDVNPSSYFHSADYSGGGAWIDGPSRQGFVTFETLTSGRAQGVIQASPTPTATTFTVDDAGDIGIGDIILATTNGSYQNAIPPNFVPGDGYPWAKCRVSAISGNDITVEGTKYDAQTGAADTTNFRAGGECFAGQKYIGGGPIGSRWTNAIRIYDPANLALAAQGSISYGAVPSTVQEIQFAGQTYPIRNSLTFSAGPMAVRGVAWDPTTKRLYVRTNVAFPDDSTVLIQVFAVDC